MRVMVEGLIIESGSHTELLTQIRRYAQAWLAELRQDSLIANQV